jgi:hypothetical protein
MKNRVSLLVSIGLMCLSAGSFTAAPSKNVPVVSSLAGVGTDPHTIRSDGAPYYHTAKGTSGVESHIQEGGAYELDLYYFTSDRKLYFDLNNIVPGTATAASPTGVVLTKGRLITKCSSTQHLLNMDPTRPLDSCALHGRFDYYGRTMLVRMGGTEAPGTRNVHITCTGTDPANPSRCQNWKLQTCSLEDADGNCTQWGYVEGGEFDHTANVITLLEEKSTSKGKVTTTKVGDYYMHFEILATKQ